MISNEDVQKLASLSRISVSDEEAGDFARDIDAILNYVGQIQSFTDTAIEVKNQRENVFRDDTHAHERGLYTDAILKEAPDTDRGYIRVKKIL